MLYLNRMQHVTSQSRIYIYTVLLCWSYNLVHKLLPAYFIQIDISNWSIINVMIHFETWIYKKHLIHYKAWVYFQPQFYIYFVCIWVHSHNIHGQSNSTRSDTNTHQKKTYHTQLTMCAAGNQQVQVFYEF